MKPYLTLLALLALAPPVLGQGLSLDAALKSLPSAPDWRSSDLTYESALRSLEAAQAAAGLKVTGSSSYNLNSSTQTLNVGASASLNVLPWSSTSDAINAAQRALERAALDRREARNTLVVSLTTQYFTARQAVQDNALAQATLKLRENQLRVADAKYQAGQLSFEDLLTAQQNLETARVNVASAAGNLEIARQTLANTLGIATSALGDLGTAPRETDLPAGSLETLIAQAQAQRADVLKAQSRLTDAQASLDIAQRDRWLPDASVNLGYSQGSGTTTTTSVTAGLNFKTGAASLSTSLPVISGTSSGTSSGFSLGLAVALPIIAPSSDAAINTAQTSLSSVQTALELARRAAELSVRQAYLEAQTAKAKVNIARAALATASKSLEVAEARLRAGTGTAIDVQIAQVGKQQAERDLDAAIAQTQIAVLKIQSAVGADLTGGTK